MTGDEHPYAFQKNGKSGQTILAVPAEQRLPGLPDVPTLKERGYNIHVGGARGFSIPAGVPKEAVAVIEAALARAHNSTMWREYATKNMYEDT